MKKSKPNALINAKSRVYALIGKPVEHSASCHMHNAAFSKLGINAIYVALEVEPAGLKDALEGVKALNMGGLNITIPHKEACMKHLDKIDKDARAIGAVNTIINRGGRLTGYNTDAAGFLDSLKHDAGVRVKGKSAFILGAGGAARALAYIISKAGAKSIFIVDAVDSKSRGLRNTLKRYFKKPDIHSVKFKDKKAKAEAASCADIIINATGLGMHAKDALPIEKEFISRKHLICDLTYNPPRTKLLKAARKKGARVLNGEGLLLYQGMRAFKIWTGLKAPEATMKKALRDFLKNKS